MRIGRSLIYILFMAVLICTGCAGQSRDSVIAQERQAPQEPQESAVSPLTMREFMALKDSSEKQWMDLSPAQYLEDFDVLYEALNESWPYFGVTERKVGVEVETLYQQYREKVSNCDNEYDFRILILDFFDDMGEIGHLAIWNDWLYYTWLDDLQQPYYDETFAGTYLDVISNETSARCYALMREFVEEMNAQLEAYNAALSIDEEPDPNDMADDEWTNVETRIIEDGKIAYVAVHSLPGLYEDDGEILLPFYESVKDYEHLIIDITGNGGGSMNYYNDLIAGPLISEPITVPVYFLMKGSENNRMFHGGLDDWHPTSEFPDLPGINREDLQEMDLFNEGVYTVEPAGEKAFGGKIWLLVDEVNYSSAEYAAMMSKHSGFATLVGTTTGGEGIGATPYAFALPNSGYIISYAAFHGLTADGRSSQEFGTEPHYSCKEGETPLELCLELIHGGE